MEAADAIIARLGLTPHPEGGSYRETWRTPAPLGTRSAGTAIYYLLKAGEVSHWHRVDAAETWHVYAGAPLELTISLDGRNRSPAVLGADLDAGQEPQATVPPHAWQSARSLGDWTLVGCTVAPAFEFSGFELADAGWQPPRLGPVVGSAWVAANRDRLVVLDVRWYLDGRSGNAAYHAGHIAGAAFVELERWVAGPANPGEGRHPMPDPDVFAEGMASLVVSDDSVVVAYDDGGGMVAGRLVWMLRALGHDAALLDGGLQGWPGPIETGAAPAPPPGRFTARPWPQERLATIDEVASPTTGTVLIDARAGERYRGETEPVDPRAGHIPGAVNVPFAASLIAPAGRFLPPHELRTRFEAVGVEDAFTAIVYCGSGVTACHDLLAMEAAGLGEGRLYPGSWSQWSSDRNRPIEPDTSPGPSPEPGRERA